MSAKIVKCIIALTVLVLCHTAGWAGDAAEKGTFKNAIGLSYVSSFGDIVDYHEYVIGAEIDFYVPVGISYHGSYEFSHGSRIGFDIGPMMLVLMEIQGPGYTENYDYWALPLKLSYGFTFIPRSTVSPYARVGVGFPLAGGDFLENQSPGLFGALGVEFMRKRRVGIGLEIGYDKSKVELLGPFNSFLEVESEYSATVRVMFN